MYRRSQLGDGRCLYKCADMCIHTHKHTHTHTQKVLCYYECLWSNTVVDNVLLVSLGCFLNETFAVFCQLFWLMLMPSNNIDEFPLKVIIYFTFFTYRKCTFSPYPHTIQTPIVIYEDNFQKRPYNLSR